MDLTKLTNNGAHNLHCTIKIRHFLAEKGLLYLRNVQLNKKHRPQAFTHQESGRYRDVDEMLKFH